jgi:hypothetical protein
MGADSQQRVYYIQESLIHIIHMHQHQTIVNAQIRSFNLKACLSLLLIKFLLLSNSFGDVIGLGNIIFDIDDDGSGEAILDDTGLGIGTLSPSANLHVMGNAITTGTLVVGGNTNTSNSNLHIHGTISQGIQWVNAGTNTITSSIVLADSSDGDVSLTMPSNLSQGTSITIKRVNTSNNLTIQDSGANIESAITVTLGAGSLSYFNVLKSDEEWVVLDGNDFISNVDVASSNLFLWWSLDEASGNVSYDSSSAGRNGNLTNDLVFSGNTTTGPMSSALSWDDPDASVLYDDGNLPTTGYTYALWSRYNLGSEDTIVVEPSVEGSAGFVWASSNGLFHRSAFHLQSDNTTYVSAQLNSTLSANTWYHIAVSWDGSDLALYLNGVYESGNTVADWASGTNIEVTNPGINDDNQFAADDLRFFTKALSSGEIRALYNAGNP